MPDYQTHLEKLRRDAADCAAIRDSATDANTRDLFERLALHLSALAAEIERAMAKEADGERKPH